MSSLSTCFPLPRPLAVLRQKGPQVPVLPVGPPGSGSQCRRCPGSVPPPANAVSRPLEFLVGISSLLQSESQAAESQAQGHAYQGEGSRKVRWAFINTGARPPLRADRLTVNKQSMCIAVLRPGHPRGNFLACPLCGGSRELLWVPARTRALPLAAAARSGRRARKSVVVK